MKDYYKILEIHPDASLEVMNNAYRALVRKYHPDLYHTTHKRHMETRMQEINEAYNVLSNATARAEYDRRYRDWVRNQKTATPPAPTRSLRSTVMNMLLWGIGTYLFLQFLAKPLLGTSLSRFLLLFAVGYLLIRFYARTRKRP